MHDPHLLSFTVGSNQHMPFVQLQTWWRQKQERILGTAILHFLKYFGTKGWEIRTLWFPVTTLPFSSYAS